MNEKDRLGDKLRDKGKAAEDLFIAEQERQARLRREQQGAASESAIGCCPRDGAKLEIRTEKEVTIDVCPTCGGVWLDRGELEAFHKVEGEAGVTRWVRSLLGA